MPQPSVVNIAGLSTPLPRPMPGAAVARSRHAGLFFLVGPGIVRVEWDGSGLTYSDVVSREQYPIVGAAAVYDDARASIVTIGGKVEGTDFFHLKIQEWSIGDGRLIGELDMPCLRTGMGAIRHRDRTLAISGQAPNGQKLPDGIAIHAAGDDGLVGDDVAERDLYWVDDTGTSAGGMQLPQIVVTKRPGEHRRVLVLNTGTPHAFEIVQRQGGPRLLTARDVPMPPQKEGAACPLFDGRGFACAEGINANNDPSDRLILWAGDGTPVVAAERLPKSLHAPALLPIDDRRFVVTGGETGVVPMRAGNSEENVEAFLVTCAA